MKVTKKIEVKEKSIHPETGDVIEGKVILSGEIVYNTYPYQERIKKYQETMLGVNLGEGATTDDDLMLATRYFDILKDRVESVSLALEDGSSITTIHELYEYAEGISVGSEIALSLVSSQKLGKKKLN